MIFSDRRIHRSYKGSVLGGVCSGLGNYFSLDPVVIRVLWVISFFGYGLGIFLYILLWVILPGDETLK